jgi:hypothetical protein
MSSYLLDTTLGMAERGDKVVWTPVPVWRSLFNTCRMLCTTLNARDGFGRISSFRVGAQPFRIAAIIASEPDRFMGIPGAGTDHDVDVTRLDEFLPNLRFVPTCT